MQMQLTSIDPATAEAWLKKVPTGSRINRRAKRNYADLLVSKRWVPSHQGPVFDTSDRLISGAELLAAIAESGITAVAKVTRDAPPHTLRLYGRGKVRSSKDVLQAVCRVKTPAFEAQVLNSVICHAMRGNASNPLEVERAHKVFAEVIDEINAIKSPVTATVFWRNATKAALAVALLIDGKRTKVREFVAELFDRREVTQPVRLFRLRLAEEYHTLSARDVFTRTLRAVAEYGGVNVEGDAETLRCRILELAKIPDLNRNPVLEGSLT